MSLPNSLPDNGDSDDDFDAYDVDTLDEGGEAELYQSARQATAQCWTSPRSTDEYVHSCSTCRTWIEDRRIIDPKDIGFRRFRLSPDTDKDQDDECPLANRVSCFGPKGLTSSYLQIEQSRSRPPPVQLWVESCHRDVRERFSVAQGHVHSERPKPNMPSRRPKPTHAFLEAVRQSLECCNLNHKKCLIRQPNPPLRLIEIHSGTHILLTTPAADKKIRFAALSYCWGKGLYGATNKANYADRMTLGMPVNDISKTIQEAIEVTSALGLKYLWADCLCIIQDDNLDKEVQIAQMPKIYAEAEITIAASCGKSADAGFLEPRYSPEEVYHFDFPRLGPHYVSLEKGDTVEPLELRAWALQETVLSRRLLSFGTKSITLSCATECVEFNPTTCRPSTKGEPFLRTIGLGLTSDKEMPDGSVGTLWLRLVEEYSRRNMTLPDDRLLAISGLADQFAAAQAHADDNDNDDLRYLAGIWDSALPRSLLWKVTPRGPSRKRLGCTNRAPSWTWGAVDGAVQFFLEEVTDNKAETLMTVHGSSVVANHEEAKYGAVRPGGYICVSGFMREARLKTTEEATQLFDPSSEHKMDMRVHLDTADEVSEKVHLLNYYSTHVNVLRRSNPDFYTIGFILEPIEGNERGFRRVGLFDAGKTTAYFEKATLETIYIY